jgi:hypothetical protein
MSPDGNAIISTTHAIDSCKGFSFSGDTNRVYIGQDEFDAYADKPSSEQSMGLPVRRFSKADLIAEVQVAGLQSILWRQTSYYNSKGAAFYAKRLGVGIDDLKDVGNSQFVVVQKSI